MIEMSVNSNLYQPQDLFDEFVDKVKYITDNDLVWNFSLFTSIESWETCRIHEGWNGYR